MKRPLIIGITGGSGSGKSTVAKNIIKEIPKINVAILNQDSYYKPHDDLSMEERAKLNYDHPLSFDNELLEHHLQELLREILWKCQFMILQFTLDRKALLL